MLHHRLHSDSILFLDDAARPDEQSIVQRWLETFPGWTAQTVSADRGCVVLTARV
jgi:hypothetical protein